MAFGDHRVNFGVSTVNETSRAVAVPTGTLKNELMVFAATNGTPAAWTSTPTGFTSLFVGQIRDDLYIGVWTKVATATDQTNAGSDTYSVGVTVPVPLTTILMAFPNADTILADSGCTPAPGTTTAADSTTSPAPVAMTMDATDLGVELFMFGENTAGAITLSYPNTGTWPGWTNVENQVGAGVGFRSGIVISKKIGGGRTGDLPQATSSVTGSWASVSLGLNPNRTDRMMSFF